MNDRGAKFVALADQVIADTRRMRARAQATRSEAQRMAHEARVSCSAATETARRVEELITAIRRSQSSS